MIDPLTHGYPSNHLASNAVCRLYDTDQITFDQWIGATLERRDGLWYIALPQSLQTAPSTAYIGSQTHD